MLRPATRPLVSFVVFVVLSVTEVLAQPSVRPLPISEQTVSRLGGSRSANEPYTLDELIRIGLERNPRLSRAAFTLDAARGKYTQAGLYPNPVFTFNADELGDRTGPMGILSPQISQEIVRGGKRELSRAVVAKEIDQATLTILNERFILIGAIRANFFEVAALQQRAVILKDLVKLADQAVTIGQKSFDAKQIARLDLVQLEVEAERFRAETESVERELPAVFRRLTATVGDARIPLSSVLAVLDESVPEYDLERAKDAVMACHPEVQIAKAGIERAQYALRRAQVEPIPNVTLSSGYIRQSQNRSNDWAIGVSVPLPVWNKNQGNIRAAYAEVGVAVQDVTRVENEVVDRLSVAFRVYASSKQRTERYRSVILPRAQESNDLSMKGFQGGQFDYLKVLQAQRALAEVRLEYNRALGEAWRSAGEISGLLLEERWPVSGSR